MIFPIFNCPLFTFSKKKKMKQWNFDITGYWIIRAGCSTEKDLELIPTLPNYSKDSWKCPFLPLLKSINWPSLVTQWFVVQNIYSKMHLVSCSNIHRGVTDLLNHKMAKNTKTWISWQQNITFLWRKKILNLFFRWHILKSYCFVAEVTFKEYQLKIKVPQFQKISYINVAVLNQT